MSEYKSSCGCKIHVAQWTSKRKLVSVKQCSLHRAAPALLSACKLALGAFERNDCIDWNVLSQAIAGAEKENQ